MKRNDPCECNSGKKYKRCCGKIRHTGLKQEPEKMTRAQLHDMHCELGDKMPDAWKEVMGNMDQEVREQERLTREKILFDKLLRDRDPLTTAASFILASKTGNRAIVVQQDDPDLGRKVQEFMDPQARIDRLVYDIKTKGLDTPLEVPNEKS